MSLMSGYWFDLVWFTVYSKLNGQGKLGGGGGGADNKSKEYELRTHLVYSSCIHRERDMLSGFLCDRHWSLQYHHTF